MSVKWDSRFMRMAELVAGWSKDPSTQVGCVLVNPDRHVIATGYNGLPRGVRDDEDRLNDRPTKYLMIQHAEVNAILQAAAPTRGATAYVTHFPCASCAGALIQAGIRRVVAPAPSGGIAERFESSFRAARQMFGETRVIVDLRSPLRESKGHDQ